MQDMTHEGYTNWETFALFAWLSNVETTNDNARAIVRVSAPGEAGDNLREYVERIVAMAERRGFPDAAGDFPAEPREHESAAAVTQARVHVGAGIRSELDASELAAVDWDDLADSFKAE